MHYKFRHTTINPIAMVEIDKSVTKALNFVNRDEQNPSGNVSDKLTKTSKIRPSKENLIAEFFSIFCKNYQKFRRQLRSFL